MGYLRPWLLAFVIWDSDGLVFWTSCWRWNLFRLLILVSSVKGLIICVWLGFIKTYMKMGLLRTLCVDVQSVQTYNTARQCFLECVYLSGMSLLPSCWTFRQPAPKPFLTVDWEGCALGEKDFTDLFFFLWMLIWLKTFSWGSYILRCIRCSVASFYASTVHFNIF